MNKTLEQINAEIEALTLEKKQVEEQTLNGTLLSMFEQMSKPEILAKIQQMMLASPMLKMEVKRLLITDVVV